MRPEIIEQLRTILNEIIDWENNAERNSYANRLIRAKKAEEFGRLANSNESEILSNLELRPYLSKVKYPEELIRILSTDFLLTTICCQILQTTKELSQHNIELYFEPNTKITYLKKADSDEQYPDCILSKTVLLVGEKDFAFAYSFGVTHPTERNDTIASAYEKFWSNDCEHVCFLLKNDTDETKAPVLDMLDKSMIIAFGVDATLLHEYPLFMGSDQDPSQRFTRIQFNCPYVEGDVNPQDAEKGKPATKKLVKNFLASAKQLLDPDSGRIHIAIQQPVAGAGSWGRSDYQISYGLTPAIAYDCGLTFVKAIGDIKKQYEDKVSKNLGEHEKPIVRYQPYLGQGNPIRINQLMFKPTKEYFDYTTDSDTDSDSETSSSNSSSSSSR